MPCCRVHNNIEVLPGPLEEQLNLNLQLPGDNEPLLPAPEGAESERPITPALEGAVGGEPLPPAPEGTKAAASISIQDLDSYSKYMFREVKGNIIWYTCFQNPTEDQSRP